MGATVNCFAGALLCVLAGLAQAAEWKLAKEEDGIRVYLQTVPGSAYKAYRGVTRVKADMLTLRELQEDAAAACSWIHECKVQKLLKREGEQAWTYTKFNAPWPVAPRDSIVRITSHMGASGVLRRELHGMPEYLPEVDGYVRVSRIDGFWEFAPKEGGEVEVTYQVHTEPGGNVPSWLANKFVVEAPYNTLRQLRSLAEDR